MHIFTTIHAYRMVHRAFRRAIRTKALIGVFSKSGDFRGWKGLARLAVGRRNALLYGHRVDFVLPTGLQGVRWFRRCGFAPCGYSPTATGLRPHRRPWTVGPILARSG